MHVAHTRARFATGNVAVAKCVLGEITDATNQGTAFSVFGFAFGFGTLIGPTLGGILAEPVLKYPSIFGSWPLLARFPYLLPCAVSAMISAIGCAIGAAFFQETLQRSKASRRRTRRGIVDDDDDDVHDEETETLLSSRDDLASTASSTASTPTSTTTRSPPPSHASLKAVSAQVILSFTAIVFQEVYVFWCYADRQHGGLGWQSNQVGLSMAVSGIALLATQVYLVPIGQRWLGHVRLFRLALALHIPMFFVTGFIQTIVSNDNDGAPPPVTHTATLWLLISLHNAYRATVQTCAFTSIMILVNNSAHNLGLVNGVAQSCSALVRAIGPALAGYLWSWALVGGRAYPFDAHFMFVLLAMVACVGWLQSLMIPRELDWPLFRNRKTGKMREGHAHAVDDASCESNLGDDDIDIERG